LPFTGGKGDLEEKPEIATEIKNIEAVGALNVEITKAVR
jgi:hypothetical protein